MRNVGRDRVLRISAVAGILLSAAVTGWAQINAMHGDGIVWHDWTFDPFVIAAAALVCLIYSIGMRRSAASAGPVRGWHHAAFAGGIGTALLALESRLGVLAHHLFVMRQLQGLLLGIVAPILIVVAMPGAALTRGLAACLQNSVPVDQIGEIEPQADSLWQMALATMLCIGVMCVWLVPPLQNAAVRSPLIAIALNVTTFGITLLFWSYIFNFRHLPAGSGYAGRIMMLWIASLAHVAVGAYLTVKTEILYSAYGTAGRPFGISALTDETVGGFVIWVPSALLCIAAAIMVIHLWGRHEDRIWAKYSNWPSSNSAALLFPTTGEQLVALARPKNRALAIAVAIFSIAVFGFTIFGGILNHMNNARHPSTHSPLVAQHFSSHGHRL